MPCCLQYSTASTMLLMPPRSGVLIWIIWPALLSAEVDDILEGVAPLVGHHLHGDAAASTSVAQGLQAEHLLFSFADIHRAFDAQMEGCGSLFQLCQIVGHRSSSRRQRRCPMVPYTSMWKHRADSSRRCAARGCGHAASITYSQQLVAVAAQLCLDIVDQRVRQDLAAPFRIILSAFS